MSPHKTRLLFAIFSITFLQFVFQSHQLDQGLSDLQHNSPSLNHKYFSVTSSRKLSHGKIKSIQVYDNMACIQQCTRMADSCFSVNFEIQATNGLHSCELLTSDKYDQPDELIEDDKFDHMSFEV
jgi:hypothetical protein